MTRYGHICNLSRLPLIYQIRHTCPLERLVCRCPLTFLPSVTLTFSRKSFHLFICSLLLVASSQTFSRDFHPPPANNCSFDNLGSLHDIIFHCTIYLHIMIIYAIVLASITYINIYIFCDTCFRDIGAGNCHRASQRRQKCEQLCVNKA